MIQILANELETYTNTLCIWVTSVIKWTRVSGLANRYPIYSSIVLKITQHRASFSCQQLMKQPQSSFIKCRNKSLLRCKPVAKYQFHITLRLIDASQQSLVSIKRDFIPKKTTERQKKIHKFNFFFKKEFHKSGIPTTVEVNLRSTIHSGVQGSFVFSPSYRL